MALEDPPGYELIIGRKIEAKEITGIKHLPQNMGWLKSIFFPQRRKAAKHTEAGFKPAKHEGGYIGCKKCSAVIFSCFAALRLCGKSPCKLIYS
jgi:hypothetical protein